MGESKSLIKHLYDIAKGNLKTVTKSITSSDFTAIATPSSGKRIVLIGLILSPVATGANGYMDVSWFVGETETPIFVNLNNSLLVKPIVLDFSSAPIYGPEDGILEMNIANSTVYVNAFYVEV